MDGDASNALRGRGINIQSTHRNNIDRYHHDDLYGISSSPPSVTREPPKFNIRKSKFYSLLGTEHTPTIPEEGTSETDPWKRKQITASEETDNSLKKCLSSPSLNTTPIERDNNSIAGEVMKHEVKALVKGRARYDIAAPHDDNESEPASTSVLKMFEKAHRRNYSDEFKLKDLTLPSKEVKVSKSQSVPASPRTSPTLRRRHLSGDKHDSPSNVSLTSKVMEHFTGSGLPKTGQIDSKPLSSVTSLYQWSSTTKVKVESRDMNVFAPTSF